MILRLILHVEWHKGYGLPRVSIKRAPRTGQKVYDKGWGWRRLVMCGPCSGVGYFDTPLNDDRTVIWPKGGELNQAVDDEIVGRYLRPTSDPDVFEDELVFRSGVLDDNDVDFAEGRMSFEQNYPAYFEDEPLSAPVRVRNYRVADEDPEAENVAQRPLQLQEEGNGDRWDNEGGYFVDYDEHGRHPDHLHYGCPFPCHEFH